MKFKRGDRVRHVKDSFLGVVANIKERGVAGSSVTWVEWIEVMCDNGLIVKAEPNKFRLIDDE